MAILKKTKNAVSKLTTKQKATLLYGNGEWETNPVNGTSIGTVVMHDGPCGLRKPLKGKLKPGKIVPDAEPSTCYPAPCLIACSWDLDAISRMTSSYAYEARLQGTDLVLTPGINIKRNPLCGRNFEYFSEDPLLSGKLGAAYVKGLQDNGVGATVKHYAANSQEFCRNINSSEIDLRALNEIYLKGFEIAVKESDPWAVMCSYNLVNGVPASDNTYLTKTTLRRRWNYDGVLMSDWGATYDRALSHENGLDLEMPCSGNHSSAILKALKKHDMTQSSLDDASERVANMYFKSINKPSLKEFNPHEEARVAAEKSIVLLKNDKKTLPLAKYDDVCVIGAFAKHPRFQGNGSSEVTVAEGAVKSFIDVINENRPEDKKIDYCQGYSIGLDEDCEYFGISKKALIKHFDGDLKKVQEFLDNKFITEASNAVASHNTTIIFLGVSSDEESEGYDRTHMMLSNQQVTLFKTLASLKNNAEKKRGKTKRIISVVTTGSPVELSFAMKSDAIVLQYLPGEAGAEALDNILSGRVNPSGKLAETWPLREMDVPSYEFYGKHRYTSAYKESIFVGYRYYLTSGREVLFPFGHGLSYTNFDYDDLKIEKLSCNKEDVIKVSFTVKNTGKVFGSEIAQVYSSYIDPRGVELEDTIIRPTRELRAFYKVHLKPGQAKRVTLEIPVSNLSYFDPKYDQYCLQGGKYDIQIGSSCEDIELHQKIEVKSDDVCVAANVDSSYFHLSKNGLYMVPNKLFYDHLGRPEPRFEEPRRFTCHSTFNDISRTFIGMIVKNSLINSSYKNVEKGYITETEHENYIKMILNTPLSMATASGLPDRIVPFLVFSANHRLLRGILALIIGR